MSVICPIVPTIDNSSNKDDSSKKDDSSNTCAVCYETLDDTKIKLECGHIFHYKCILSTFKSNLNKKTRNPRKCPFCRYKCGYLELRENIYPTKNIHYEFYEIERYLLRNEFDKIKEITNKYLDKSLCNAIIKTGKNKGYQCKKRKKKGCDYCYLHLG